MDEKHALENSGVGGDSHRCKAIPVQSHLSFVPRINLPLRPGSIFGTMNISLLLIPVIYHPILCNGDEFPPCGELASLGRESSIDDRDGISQFPSPPRMVELLPVDRVSIDMPPYNDVSTYGTLIREHKSPYKLPPQEERAMNTYPAGRDARDHPASSDEPVLRDRLCYGGIGHRFPHIAPGLHLRRHVMKTRFRVTTPQPPEVLVEAHDPTLTRANGKKSTPARPKWAHQMSDTCSHFERRPDVPPLKTLDSGTRQSLRSSYQPAHWTRFNCRHDEYLSIPHPNGFRTLVSTPDVELSPVDQVSIDMPPCNDVSTYGTLIREHDSPYKIPSPKERAMKTYPAGSPVPSDVAITRTRELDDGDECKRCFMISCGWTAICSLLIGVVLWVVLGYGSG
ncbi:hypothetical protein PSTT_03216, partial [Puccinia striiformis]